MARGVIDARCQVRRARCGDYVIIRDMDAKRKIPYVAMNWVKLAGEFVALSAATAFAAAARAGEVFERAAGKVTCAR